MIHDHPELHLLRTEFKNLESFLKEIKEIDLPKSASHKGKWIKYADSPNEKIYYR